MDNDATANFDRIVCNIAAIACRRLGMPKQAEQCHNDTLFRLRYNVKTGHGTSQDTYGSTTDNPMQGQGQGSGNAPSCWGAVSTPMWTALDAISPTSFTSKSADRTISNKSHGVAFVDDATVFLNDIDTPTMDEATLTESLQNKAQSWERLLHTTGGALKPSKCFCYIMIWDWASGFPILRSKRKITHPITIIDSPSHQPVTINMKGYGEAERTLGVRIAPIGTQTSEIAWLTEKAATFAKRISQGHLSREEAAVAYHSVYIPRMTYSLGSTTLSPDEARKIQSEPLMTILPALGINRNMKRAAVFGPAAYGGHNIKCLFTEQGIQQLEILIGHLRLQSSIGTVILATISMHQLTAGITNPILAHPDIPLKHLDPGWITSIREFLSHINARILITTGLVTLSPARLNDKLIMEIFANDPTYGAATLQKLNHCRIFLQAVTLSDICNGAGTEILREALIGTDPIPGSSSIWLWPRQPSPPSSSWSVWRSAIRKHFLISHLRNTQLRPSTRLGAWLPTFHSHHRKWTHHVDPSTGTVWQAHPQLQNTHQSYFSVRPHTTAEFRVANVHDPPTSALPATAIPATHILSTSYMTMYSAHPTGTPSLTPNANNLITTTPEVTFAAHLNSLPQWEIRLLLDLHESGDLLQAITDTQPLIIACDGSLEGHSGCFGWVIGTTSDIHWTGAGPADGSPKCMSSQRTELFGILSALRFIHHFTTYHNCFPPINVTLVCDNKSALQYAAIPHIGLSAIQTSHPDFDVAAEIHTTIRILRFRVVLKWVRGHQDRTTSYDKLPREAQLNVHADTAAGNFQRDCPPHSRSRRNGPHTMPSCHALLTIADHRITGNHKLHIREASLLPPLRKYIEERNSWTVHTWDLVDWTSHGRCLSSYPKSQQLTITKFLHRWLPVGHHLAKLNSTNPSTCGACNAPDETDDHICQCPQAEANTLRTTARTALIKSLQTCGTDPTVRNLLTYGIGEWLEQNTRHVEMAPPAEHPFRYELIEAIAAQNAIGWDQIFRGRLAHAWGTCYVSWLAYAPQTPDIKKLNHTSWTSLIIKWSWDLFLSLWHQRNTLAHSATTEETTNALQLRAQLKVRDRYARSSQLRGDFPDDVTFYFSEPLDTFLLKATHILDAWVIQVDRIFDKHTQETLTRNRRGQLTHFFPRRPRTPHLTTLTQNP
jgi:hypothetical protein